MLKLLKSKLLVFSPFHPFVLLKNVKNMQSGNIWEKLLRWVFEEGQSTDVRVNHLRTTWIFNDPCGVAATSWKYLKEESHLVSEFDTVELVGRLEKLRPEGGGDELSVACQLHNHVCEGNATQRWQTLTDIYSFIHYIQNGQWITSWHFTWDGLPVLGVEGLVDLVKQVERSGVAFLNGKYESQSHQGLLTSRELLHLSHLTLLPREGHLHRTARRGVRETQMETPVFDRSCSEMTDDQT